jgi:ATP-binding protein involved in chromosome partitioning
VGSGKGGVGKSTVTLNLALAMAEQGAAVGILDADVFGPDIPVMMNLTRKTTATSWELVRNPEAGAQVIEPMERNGLKIFSSAFIVGESHPVTWASAFVDMLLDQFLNVVNWGPLDYLFVDLPPGTADLQQKVVGTFGLSGTVVVVTPQDVAHLDAKKVITMYRNAGARLLGGVENMSGMSCPHCDGHLDIFPRVREERSIWSMGVDRLGAVPLDPAVGASGNADAPVMLTTKDSAAAWAFRQIADRIASLVGQNA